MKTEKIEELKTALDEIKDITQIIGLKLAKKTVKSLFDLGSVIKDFVDNNEVNIANISTQIEFDNFLCEKMKDIAELENEREKLLSNLIDKDFDEIIHKLDVKIYEILKLISSITKKHEEVKKTLDPDYTILTEKLRNFIKIYDDVYINKKEKI